MSSIKHYIANSTGELDKLIDLIDKSLARIIPITVKDLEANQIDIIFVSAAREAIPEYGIGGSSPGPNHIYVSFDPKSDKITQQVIEGTLFHEIHHCMRWRGPGYGKSLGEAIVTEGLACLYEEQRTGKVPIYAKIRLDKEQINLATKTLQSKDYNHDQWFFGRGKIDRWFGYTFGYRICRDYSIKKRQNAAQLVNVAARDVLASLQNKV